MGLQQALNTIATENFRDQADQDYICARINYRMTFREQFLWAGLQALEKYFKAILLFNGKSARWEKPADKKRGEEFGHNLTRLFAAVTQVKELAVEPPEWFSQFIKYLETFGFNRYFTFSTYVVGDELRKLDESVWAIRRYCLNIHWAPKGKDICEFIVSGINKPENREKPRKYVPFQGVLETILKSNQNDPARKALIWNNLFYGNRRSDKVTYSALSTSAIPPHERDWFKSDPELTEIIKNYVKL